MQSPRPGWGVLTTEVSAGTAALLSGTFVGVVVLLLFSRCCRRRAASCSSWKVSDVSAKVPTCSPKCGHDPKVPASWPSSAHVNSSARCTEEGTEAQRSLRAVPGPITSPRPCMCLLCVCRHPYVSRSETRDFLNCV